MAKIGMLVIALVAIASCNKKSNGQGSAADDGKPQTLALGDSGFVVDVPAGWSVKENRKGMFVAVDSSGHGALDIEDASSPASKPDELADACDGRKVVTSEALPGGGAAVSCSGPSTAVQGVTMTLVHVSIARDANSSLSCFHETDHDPAPLLTICKSIRKK